MQAYEYIRLYFDFGDLAELNRISSAGWRVISVQSGVGPMQHTNVALLERTIQRPNPKPDRDGKGYMVCGGCGQYDGRHRPGCPVATSVKA